VRGLSLSSAPSSAEAAERVQGRAQPVLDVPRSRHTGLSDASAHNRLLSHTSALFVSKSASEHVQQRVSLSASRLRPPVSCEVENVVAQFIFCIISWDLLLNLRLCYWWYVIFRMATVHKCDFWGRKTFRSCVNLVFLWISNLFDLFDVGSEAWFTHLRYLIDVFWVFSFEIYISIGFECGISGICVLNLWTNLFLCSIRWMLPCRYWYFVAEYLPVVASVCVQNLYVRWRHILINFYYASSVRSDLVLLFVVDFDAFYVQTLKRVYSRCLCVVSAVLAVVKLVC